MPRKRDKKGRFIKSNEGNKKAKEKLSLKKPPKPVKMVACNILRRLGFSYRQVGAFVDVSKDSAKRYSQVEIPPELRQFATKLEEVFSGYEVILAAKAAHRVNETIVKAKIGEALEVYKTMRGLDKPGIQPQQTQVNIFTRLQKEDKEFIEGEEVK